MASCSRKAKLLYLKLNLENKKLITKEDLLQEFKKSDANVYVTIGAGDIGEMVSEIKKIVDEKA